MHVCMYVMYVSAWIHIRMYVYVYMSSERDLGACKVLREGHFLVIVWKVTCIVHVSACLSSPCHGIAAHSMVLKHTVFTVIMHSRVPEAGQAWGDACPDSLSSVHSLASAPVVHSPTSSTARPVSPPWQHGGLPQASASRGAVHAWLLEGHATSQYACYKSLHIHLKPCKGAYTPRHTASLKTMQRSIHATPHSITHIFIRYFLLNFLYGRLRRHTSALCTCARQMTVCSLKRTQAQIYARGIPTYMVERMPWRWLWHETMQA